MIRNPLYSLAERNFKYLYTFESIVSLFQSFNRINRSERLVARYRENMGSQIK